MNFGADGGGGGVPDWSTEISCDRRCFTCPGVAVIVGRREITDDTRISAMSALSCMQTSRLTL